MPNVPVDPDGNFRYTFTIPAQLDPYQGHGGGPVKPGRYDFAALPTGMCPAASFTVT
jgi:hypothetical protein